MTVQSPFYPEGETSHVYVLHPPGGVVGGDSLSTDVRVGVNAQVLLTTPAATKLYRSGGRTSFVQQRLHAAAESSLEWLPQETLVFSGAQSTVSTRVDLHKSSRFIGWELVGLGRPASGERFINGTLRQDIEVWIDDIPVVIDRTKLCAGSRFMEANFGLDGHVSMATVVAYPAHPHVLEAARQACRDAADCRAAATVVDNILVCRALAQNLRHIQRFTRQLWSALRPGLLSRSPIPPRIWAT